jgi:hypothetical protein
MPGCARFFFYFNAIERDALASAAGRLRRAALVRISPRLMSIKPRSFAER